MTFFYFSPDCESRGEGTNETQTNSSDEEYDYNMDSMYTIPMDEFVPYILVYGATFILGVLGNILVIFSIAKFRYMQSVTNIFLTSLASADLMLVFFCVPIKVSFRVRVSSRRFNFSVHETYSNLILL